MRIFFKLIAVLFLVFIVPALLHLGVWMMKDRPSSWSQANWSSANILPEAADNREAKIYIMSARTGGLKGAFATHSWLVLKPENAIRYDRYDVVGWGRPVRKNGYDADARWYSNVPVIQREISGTKAAQLIPQVEKAIAAYPWRQRGDYTIWPGPNSNTFVASIIRAVPGFEGKTPTTAVGRDYPAYGNWFERDHRNNVRASLGGFAGIVIGPDDGLELNFLGLVAGVNPAKGEIKVPAFGTFKGW